MRFSLLFPLMLLALGGAMMLHGCVPAQETSKRLVASPEADPVPVETPRGPPVSQGYVVPAVPAPSEAPPLFFMPVAGVMVAEVHDSFGDPRGTDRLHKGIDIMAERGTPVTAAAPGVVRRISNSDRGGLSVTILGSDGLRYFYAHLDAFAPGLSEGQAVGVDTVIGFVGNTGNAAATAPHLHFEVSRPIADDPWSWQAFDPLPFLLDRSPAVDR